MADVQVKGLDQMARALQQFPQILGKKYLASALYAGAKIIKDEAIARAPEDTGQLKSKIATFKQSGADNLHAQYNVGIRTLKLTRKLKRVASALRKIANVKRLPIEGDLYYGRMQELGYHDRKGVFHQHAFLRPAFEARWQDAVQAFRDKIAANIKAAEAEASK